MSAALPSYHEHYTQGAFAPYVRGHKLAGSTGQLFEMAQPAGDFSDPAVSEFVLVRAVSDGISQRSDLGGGRFERRTPAGTLFLVPPATATEIVAHNPHVIRLLAVPALHLRPHLEEARPGGDPFDFGPLHAGPFRNPLVLSLMDQLWDEAEEGDGAGRLFADSAILAIAAQLARQAGRSAQPEPTRGGLAPWQVRRVREYLAAHLADDVTLAELAALVHLSPAHFCRAHKQATGHSPLQSLTALRVERAKTLVADPHLPVIEVAAACGYKSPSAFAQVFRRETGMTPTEWRRRRA